MQSRRVSAVETLVEQVSEKLVEDADAGSQMQVSPNPAYCQL